MMVDGLVELLVTPEAIAAVSRGVNPATPDGAVEPEPVDEREPRVSLRGPNEFIVEFADGEERDVPRLVFDRRGLQWRLTRILFREDA
jgi:hypothetical protein